MGVKRDIEKWKNLTDKITSRFIKEYFELEEGDYVDADWIDIGGVFNFSDYWFSFSNILDCCELGVTKEQLFDWYDKSLTQEIDLTLRDFIILPEKQKEQKEKYLEDLKQRVEFAKEEFEKAIKEYDTNS
jgi:hypothetical protein